MEWTGLEFAWSQRAVENMENGGNHLWCPNDMTFAVKEYIMKMMMIKWRRPTGSLFSF